MITGSPVENMKSFRKNRATMDFVVYGVLLFFGFARNSVDCTAWVDDLSKYVSESSEFKQVRIMSQLDENKWFQSPVIDELFEKLIQTMPTLTINFDKDFKPPAQSVLGDTSATFFLFVFESRNGLPIHQSIKCFDAMKKMGEKHYASKYMIASFVRTPSPGYELLLQHAWDRNILQLAIVELVEPEVLRTSILVERPVILPMTYQLNRFKKEIIGKVWTADVKSLYQDKVKNMWGYPLRISTDDPFSKREYVKANTLLLDIIMQQLNCSKKNTASLFWSSEKNVTKWHMLPKRYRNNGNIMSDLYPVYSDFFKSLTKTVPVIVDKSHFVVPIFTKSETLLSTNFLWASGLSFGIVIMYWTFTRLIGLDSQSWGMLNITWILFGFSVTRQPRGNAERILFASLLVIFAFYSSELYSSLTEVTTQRITEKKFETLDDLIDSQLQLEVDYDDLERVRDVFDRGFKNLSPELRIKELCLSEISNHKNTSCLVGKMFADRYISNFTEEGRPTMKIAEPAMWTELYSFPMEDGSPYLPNFDKIIMRLQSIGLIQKIYYDEFKLEKMNKLPVDPTDVDTLFRHVIYLGIFGYSISFIILIIEIIYHRVSIHRKSKRLSGLFPIRNKIRPKRDEFSVLTDLKNIYKAFYRK